MARLRYFYNTESCQFEKPVLNLKTFSVHTLKHLFIGTLVTAAFGAGLFFGIDNIEHQAIRSNINELKNTVHQFEGKIGGLEIELNDIQDKDNQFHHDVLKMDVQFSSGPGFGEPAAPERTSQNSMPSTMSEIKSQLNDLGKKVQNQTDNFIRLEEKLKQKSTELRHIPSIRPVKGSLVSGFGQRSHPLLKIDKMHQGMDFAAEIGTEVTATGDGIISFAGTSQNGYGVHVDIDHGFGFETRYAHLSKIIVASGKYVKRGQVIGYTGNSGLVKGPHLHYEIMVNGKKVNPVDYFYTDLGPEDYVRFKEIALQFNESMD